MLSDKLRKRLNSMNLPPDIAILVSQVWEKEGGGSVKTSTKILSQLAMPAIAAMFVIGYLYPVAHDLSNVAAVVLWVVIALVFVLNGLLLVVVIGANSDVVTDEKKRQDILFSKNLMSIWQRTGWTFTKMFLTLSALATFCFSAMSGYLFTSFFFLVVYIVAKLVNAYIRSSVQKYIDRLSSPLEGEWLPAERVS
jgi:hypothetical protein